MNEYLKEYIELQKQFRETKGNPDSVRALYTFKEKLELSEDKQAKEVLVDVYDLLDFKKDAYELSATAAARRPIFSIQAPFTLWRILSICARSVSPVAKQPGNMTAASRTIALWIMV